MTWQTIQIRRRNVTDVSLIPPFSLPLSFHPRYPQPQAQCGIPRVTGCTRLNVSLPFSLHPGDVLLIAAALGAIAGLTLFFHGFSLLQQRWPAPGIRPAKIAHPVTTTTTDIPDGAHTPVRDPRSGRAEVIKLTPHDGPEISSASMTQQGRIAAALLKAGIPSPATWSSENRQATLRVEDPAANKPTSAASDVEISRALQQDATSSASRSPALDQAAGRYSSNWNATLLIWGGPALTLACIYLMAAHLGWL